MKLDSALQVERWTTSEQLTAAKSAWHGLARGVPFRGFDWLHSWWQSYSGETTAARSRELCVLAVRDSAGDLVGLAPWYLERIAGRGCTIRFLGSGEVCSDYLTILCKGGWEDRVASSLAHWLHRARCKQTEDVRWNLLALGGVYPQDEVVLRLVGHLSEQGAIVKRRQGLSCWRIDLPGSWDEYLARVSKSHRKQIRRLERNLFESGRARVFQAEDEASLQHGTRLLTDLHQRRREGLGEAGCFASPRFTTFHADVSRQLLHSGALRLLWLEIDGQPAAVEYQILGRDVVYAYQSGVDPAALDHEPGRLITIASLQKAIQEGRHAFDFLRGDEQYKAHWRAVPRPTQHVLILPNTSAARLRTRYWQARDSVKSWVRNGLKRSKSTTG